MTFLCPWFVLFPLVAQAGLLCAHISARSIPRGAAARHRMLPEITTARCALTDLTDGRLRKPCPHL